MTDNHRTILVAAIALMTVVGMGAVTVAAQEGTTETETPIGNETATAAAENATAAGNATATPAAENATATAAAAQNATVTAEAANVTFGNQSTNGTYVVINRTVLPEGGFIALFTVNESVAANATMAAAQNATATNETANATATVEDESLTETPANGTATEAGAMATATNETANATGTPMNATATEAGAMATAGANATVSPVTLTEVNESALGMFVGNSTYLEPGVHQNVTVQYRPNLRQTNDQVLIAVAYHDAGEDQAFDGVENATAYVQNGTIVGDWAYVTVGQTVAGANATATNATATPGTATETAAAAGANETAANATATGTMTNGTATETETELAG